MPIALLIRRGIRRVCCIKEMCFDGSDDEDQQGEQKDQKKKKNDFPVTRAMAQAYKGHKKKGKAEAVSADDGTARVV